MTRTMVSRRADMGTMVPLGGPRGEVDAAVDNGKGWETVDEGVQNQTQPQSLLL